MRMSYARLADQQPYQKIGICCGAKCKREENTLDQILFRVREYVYRCKKCFRRETGHHP